MHDIRPNIPNTKTTRLVPLQESKNISIVFGRFQPFHNQHAELLKTAWAAADYTIVVLGSANKPRTPKNPFTTDERFTMIQNYKHNNESISNKGTYIVEVNDYAYSDSTWIQEVQNQINSVTKHLPIPKIFSAVVVGCKKDESSYYLDMFPNWDFFEIPFVEQVSATDIRELLFSDNSINFVKGVVPESTMNFLQKYINTEEYKNTKTEHEIIENYKKSWEAAPYAPTFVTTDAVVIQSGHILLIERKAYPGKGLWALPGGFLDINETIKQGIVRELREETKLKVPVPVLEGGIQEIKVFDSPNRSERGRTITHAGLIVLKDGPLPRVRGADDAAKAKWFPLSSIDSTKLYEDHLDIINYFKARV